ncbi:hypothetical protein ACWF94_38275 [Streptomyces sp. NPDC055078]
MTASETREEYGSEPESRGSVPDGKGPGRRRGLVIAGALTVVCAALIGYGLLGTGEEKRPAHRAAPPTAEVTYEVTGEGTAEISYRTGGGPGSSAVVRNAALPWTKSVRLPPGQTPTVAVVLGDRGGRAVCTLAVRGEHVQRATATGRFGRATCGGERLPG